jgi:type II secretory pathway pseudopilin PulG
MKRYLRKRQTGYMKNQSGFTLMEILVVFVLLIFIIILFLLNTKSQINKANDVKRKTDLGKIQKAFEDYYNDKNCYPPEDVLSSCGSNALSPFLKNVPCDPIKKTPYLYVASTPTTCVGYRACTQLENLKDADIERIGCDPVLGCGWAQGFNYCVAVGLEVAPEDFGLNSGGSLEGGDGAGPATPTTTPEPGVFACSPGGDCKGYGDPGGAECPWTYANPGCVHNGVFQCQFIANRCKNF